MPSSHSVYWTNTAQEDLTAIIDYIACDSIDRALRIYQKIKNAAGKLNNFPERGRIVPELKHHNIETYRELIVEPWRIVYKIEIDTVYVLAVFDARRNLEDILLERILKN
jgi:toxin ParE1/3/4